MNSIYKFLIIGCAFFGNCHARPNSPDNIYVIKVSWTKVPIYTPFGSDPLFHLSVPMITHVYDEQASSYPTHGHPITVPILQLPIVTVKLHARSHNEPVKPVGLNDTNIGLYHINPYQGFPFSAYYPTILGAPEAKPEENESSMADTLIEKATSKDTFTTESIVDKNEMDDRINFMPEHRFDIEVTEKNIVGKDTNNTSTITENSVETTKNAEKLSSHTSDQKTIEESQITKSTPIKESTEYVSKV